MHDTAARYRFRLSKDATTGFADVPHGDAQHHTN